MPSPDGDDRLPVRRVVILGTGGTIAGRAQAATDNVGYRAGVVSVEDLVRAVPPLRGRPLETERVAQLDSKDMDHATWQSLARRCGHHLARDEVAGVVVTHGTDTLEETAWFLHRLLAPAKPLVLTAAMRPASALQADGPQNLFDAVTVASCGAARGVLAVLAGAVHGAHDLQKMHGYRIDAFASPNDGALGFVEEGRVRAVRAWPEGEPLTADLLDTDSSCWPWVALLTSHAGADARHVRALVQAGVAGLIIAGTGNGTVHQAWLAALAEARAAGVAVRRASRCSMGTPVPAAADNDDALASYPRLNAVKARVELMLELLAARRPGDGTIDRG